MKFIDPVMFNLSDPSIRFFWMWMIPGLWVMWHWLGFKYIPGLIKNSVMIIYYLSRIIGNTVKRFFNNYQFKKESNHEE